MAEQQDQNLKFETFYAPLPVKEDPIYTTDFSKVTAGEKRPDPFRLADFRGVNAYQKPT